MRLQSFVIGAPLCVLWLLLLTVSPLFAIIVLLMAVAWLDHRHRAVVGAHPADDDSEGVAK